LAQSFRSDELAQGLNYADACYPILIGNTETMMDVQSPYIAAAKTSATTNAQNTPRQGSTGNKREAAGSGKSFSSALHAMQTAKEPREKTGLSQSDGDKRDAQTPSDEAVPSTMASTSSGATRGDSQVEDKGVESSKRESDSAATAAAPVNDASAQSVVLALISQSVATTDIQPLKPMASVGQTTTAMESVMSSVTEDGTSLPVTAADSSTFSQIDRREMTATPTDTRATIQSDTAFPSAIETTIQPTALADRSTTLSNGTLGVPEEHQMRQSEHPTIPPTHEKSSQDSVKGATKTESIIPPNHLPSHVEQPLYTSDVRTAEQVGQPEENQLLAMERQIHALEPPGSKEEAPPRQLSATPIAWQEPTSQGGESDMEQFGHDHRERPSADQVGTPAAMPEAPSPATPTNSTMAHHGMDHRAFSSAASAKLSADTEPTVATPPVQSTDWMPGSSATQTKSMILELSQADLGRVNIRVAVNQDTVHTHFTSERSELGQYLMNGQDRLQSALTASGLDLGRFQVDIDRQSAGRSFQQPTSQEQSQGHTSQRESQHAGQGREEVMRDSTPRRGMLNLVA